MREDLDQELWNYTFAVLGEVPEWRVTAAEWEYLDGLVEAAATAMAQRHWGRLRDAVDELELASPLRATRLGKHQQDGQPEQSVPEVVRERVNRLVHDLHNSDRPQPISDSPRDD